jgi:AAA domain
MSIEIPPPDPRLAGKVKVLEFSAPQNFTRVPSANGHSGSTCFLVSRCAAEIRPEKVDWLWPGRLALGKHTCIAGEPGTGKSQLSIAIVAALTTGGEWPCGEGEAPLGNAIILSAEDGVADTIVPRLLAASADLSRVHVVSAIHDGGGGHRGFDLQRDLELLESAGSIGVRTEQDAVVLRYRSRSWLEAEWDHLDGVPPRRISPLVHLFRLFWRPILRASGGNIVWR